MSEVYCEDCAHIMSPYSTCDMTGNLVRYKQCNHPNNKRYSDAWFRKNPRDIEYIKSPMVKNKNNDCSDFKECFKGG